MNDLEISHSNAEPALYQTSATFTPNEDQEKAIAKILEFIQSPFGDWNFVFRGYAGTGKTTCMREIVRRSASSRAQFVYTTPTNKAAKVLKEVTGEAQTIYSLLGLRVDKNGETKQITHGKPVDLSDIDVIFVDEASMVNEHLYGILQDTADRFSLKVVFMGDPAQLPPVKEKESLSLRADDPSSTVELTKVMRHDNQILDLVTEIRGTIFTANPTIVIKNNNSGGEGVWKMLKNDFKKKIFEAAAAGHFADGRTAKIVSWRNVKVTEYNNIVRAAIFGAEAIPGFFLPGDRIVAGGPCERGDELLMHTDDEAIVESTIDCKHPLNPQYNAIEVKARTEDNRIVRLLALHPSSAVQFANDSQQLAHEAQANSKLWKRFWDHKDMFHDVRYGNALTAHRSQGSTYRDVFVDFQDILYNRNRREAFQCFYVACSRAQKRLFLA